MMFGIPECIPRNECEYAIQQASAVSHEHIWLVLAICVSATAANFLIDRNMKWAKYCIWHIILSSLFYLIYFLVSR